jgi:hypothetical protein
MLHVGSPSFVVSDSCSMSSDVGYDVNSPGRCRRTVGFGSLAVQSWEMTTSYVSES